MKLLIITGYQNSDVDNIEGAKELDSGIAKLVNEIGGDSRNKIIYTDVNEDYFSRTGREILRPGEKYRISGNEGYSVYGDTGYALDNLRKKFPDGDMPYTGMVHRVYNGEVGTAALMFVMSIMRSNAYDTGDTEFEVHIVGTKTNIQVIGAAILAKADKSGAKIVVHKGLVTTDNKEDNEAALRVLASIGAVII